MSNEDRQRIASVARSWKGTPFFPRVGIKSVGVDCPNLIVEVYFESGIIKERPLLPVYSIRTTGVFKRSIAREFLSKVTWAKETSELLIGNIVLLLVEGVDNHSGIVVSESTFVHAVRRLGTVESLLQDSTWKKRIMGMWEPVIV